MEIYLYIFELLGGIGLFLFAMYLLQKSLKQLSGRNFKLFLQRITKNRVGAVTGGAIVTGVLQSSSMVSIIVIAFVSAGVFTMRNALAIILGANLGTTLDSWLVATLGFKMNIEIVAYPIIFIGSLLLVIFDNRKFIKYTSYFLIGFGLLFIGLSFMKMSMEAQVKLFDFSKYAEMPTSVFLLIGFTITLLIQSSSATMALTLTGIQSGAIDFTAAAAIVLGSETGTTLKTLLASIGSNASAKRVALGNILFNVFLTIAAFILLKPILELIANVFLIKDPLIGLVVFSTLINLLSIVIFLPILDPFSRFLERFFKDSAISTTAFISHSSISEPETALDLFEKETSYFIHNSLLFNSSLMEIDNAPLEEPDDFKKANENRKFLSKTAEEKYEFLKQLQGELQTFYIELRPKLQNEQNIRLSQLNKAIRSSMYSIKSMKDIGSNIYNLKQSTKDIKFSFIIHHQKETEALYQQLNVLINHPEKVSFDKLQNIFSALQSNFSAALNNFYQEASNAVIEDIDITTILNFNRELFTSNKAILMAVKDFLLHEKQAEDFNEILVYKT